MNEDDIPFDPVEGVWERDGYKVEVMHGLWTASAPGLPPCVSSREHEAMAMLADEALAAGNGALAVRLRLEEAEKVWP